MTGRACLSLLAVSLALCPVGASAQRGELPILQQELTWRGENAQEDRTAFALLTMPPDRRAISARRVLFSDGRTRLIGTWLYDRERGSELYHLLDDETGWWVRLEVRFGVRSLPGEEYPQYSRRLEDWLNDRDHRVEFRLRTSDGFEAREGLGAGPLIDDLARELGAVLEQSEDWREARRSIPPDVAASTVGWERHLGVEFNLNPIFEFLATAARASDNAPAEGAVVSKTQMRQGIEPDSPRWRELLRTFEHFDPDNPFPDDLFAPADPP